MDLMLDVSNNQNIYTNYQKTKKEDSVLPIEAFKIDESNILKNKNQIDKNDNINRSSIESWIYYNLKNETDKNILIHQHFKENDLFFWENWGNNPTAGDIENEWANQVKNATFGNVYEDAKDFESFVNNWIEKGYSEMEALERANFYAIAGLLDYGKQKAIALYSEYLGYDDKKQHGFHLIDNPPLKKAFLETLDSLDTGSVADLVSGLFLNYPSKTTTSFEDLLKQYGVTLEELKETQPEEERSKFTFTGDININEQMSLKYQNFIFDTLIGFFEDRVNSFRESIEKNPKNPNLYFELSIILKKQSKWWQQIEALKSAIKLDASNGQLYYELAEANYKMNRFEEAAECFERAIQLKNSKDSMWFYKMGESYEKSGKIQKSELAYKKAIEFDKKFDSKRFGIGIFHQQRGLWKEVADSYEKQIEINSFDDELYYKLGMAYDRLYDWEHAAKMYSKALLINQKRPYTSYRLGFVDERMKKYSLAQKAYDFAIEL